MPRHHSYEAGTYLMRCDQCGRSFRNTEMMLRWDNAWVDAACWEPRHPQDFVRGIPDNQSVPFARPRILDFDTYLDINTGGLFGAVSGPWAPFGTYFECTVYVALDDWTPGVGDFQTLYCDRTATGGFNFFVDFITGTLSFLYTVPGNLNNLITSSAAPTVNNGEALYVKIVAELTTSECTVTFYTSTDGTTFSQLGTVQTGNGGTNFVDGGGLPIFGHTSYNPTTATTAGKFYTVEVIGSPGAEPRLYFDADQGAANLPNMQVGPLVFQTFGNAEFITP